MASKNQSIKVGPLRERELEEADRIARLAFGTFLGLPNPLEFMGDRDFITPRWRSSNTAVLAGLGVAMHRPHGRSYIRPRAYLLGDWR